MTTYAVTGASGHLGHLAVASLLTRGVPAGQVVALARTTDKAADLASRGVDVRHADYTDPATLRPALAGGKLPTPLAPVRGYGGPWTGLAHLGHAVPRTTSTPRESRSNCRSGQMTTRSAAPPRQHV